MMYPKLTQWIKGAEDLIGTRLTPFTYISESKEFLQKCRQVLKKARKDWTPRDKFLISVFRMIRDGKAAPIRNYTQYVVTDDGKVYRVNKTKKLTQTQTIKGYNVVNLNNGKQKTFLVHRLVAEYHVPNPDPERLTDVHHLDNDRGHNESFNLIWTSHSANMRLVTVKEYIPPDRICPYCGEISPPTT